MPRRQRRRATWLLPGGALDQRGHLGLEALAAHQQGVDRPDPVEQDRLGDRLGKLDPPQPVEMALGPVVALEAKVVAQQELGDAVAGPHQVSADVLARADQVAHRLLGRRWHPDSVQAADHQQAHQPLGVAAVGLDPVLGRALDLARGRDRAVDAPRCQRPGQPEAGRAGLIGDPHRRRQRGAEFRHLLGRTAHPLHPQLRGLGVGDRRDHLRRVNIQTHPRPNLRHVGTPMIAVLAEAIPRRQTRASHARVPTFTRGSDRAGALVGRP